MNMRLTVDCISVGPKTDEGADNLNIMAMHRQRGRGGGGLYCCQKLTILSQTS